MAQLTILIGVPRRAIALSLSLLIAFPVSGLAQSADQLQQVQQLMQQRQNSGAINAVPAVPQDIIMQPVQSAPEIQLPPSRLEQILSARAGSRLRQFGYDQLGSGRSVTVPQTGAVQDDYVLGPSDEIVVSLRGQENSELRVIVDRNGQIILPRLSPISASGRSFGSFRQDIEAAVRRAYVATSAFVSIGRVRQISVSVSGEVNYPGQRIVTGLSSAMDALLLSGGVKKTGSLRSVRIQRGGHEYTVDLYSVLTNRGVGSNMRLADGDRILVPPLGRTVAITGLVRQPGIYELPVGQSSMPTRTLMSLAGGQEVRGRYRLSVLRFLPDGQSVMTALQGETGQIGDSEILFVQLGADRTASRATLSGGTSLAGSYPIVVGTLLSEVLKAPGAMGNSPYTPFGVIVRKDPATLMRSLIAFTPVAVLAGREDQTLKSDDIIRILSVNEIQMLNFIVQSYAERLAVQQNAIRNPLGQTPGSDNSLAKSILSKSGLNLELEDVASVPASVQRQQVVELLDVAAPGTPLAQQQIAAQRESFLQDQQRQALQQGAQQAQNGQPYQQQQGQQQGAQQQQQQQQQQQPQQQGNLQSQAPYQTSMQGAPFQTYRQNGQGGNGDGNNSSIDSNNDEPSRNFVEQSVDASGFASNREVQTFGQLSRQLGIDPLILMNFLVDRRARLDGALRGPGYYFVGPSASLNDLVQAAGGTINWADESGVELISTAADKLTGRAVSQRQTMSLHQGTLASYIVRPRDQIRFGQIFTSVGVGSVTVQGEVRNGGTFPILRGDHLSDVLARAGGLTNNAFPYGTVFLRQSAAQTERESYIRAASEVQNQLIIAMTRVGNDKIDPSTFASMQTFVTELRNQRALGRISVTADPSVLAANAALDPLLEQGDVIYIPQRPSTVSVLGQVLQPGSYPYRAGKTFGDYIEQAGGYASTADESQTFIVLPDGTARRIERSWLNFSAENLPPGSAIMVPRDVTPLDLRQTIIDVSQIFSQFAVAIASVAVLSKQ